MGPATATQIAYRNTLEQYITTSSYWQKSTKVNDNSGKNFTSVLLSAAQNYEETQFYRQQVAAFSFAPGPVWLRSGSNGDCEYLSNMNNVWKVGPLNWNANIPISLVLWKTEDFSVSNEAILTESAATQSAATSSFGERFDTSGRVDVHWVPNGTTGSFAFWCNASSHLEIVMGNTSSTTGGLVSTAYFNRRAVHSTADGLNVLGNVIARQHLGKSDAQFTAYNCPLPASVEDDVDKQSSVGFDAATQLVFGLGIFCGGIAALPLSERASGSRLIQQLAGLRYMEYWLGLYIWDVINGVALGVCSIIVFAAFQLDEFSGERLGGISLLFLLFSWAVPFHVYLLTNLFKSVTGGVVGTFFLTYFVPFLMLMVVYILPVIESDSDSNDLEDIAEQLRIVFMLSPTYALAQGVADVSANYYVKSRCARLGASMTEFCLNNGGSTFGFEFRGLGWCFVMLLIDAPIYAMLMVLVEKYHARGSAQSPSTAANTSDSLDRDVAREKVAVAQGSKESVLRVRSISKRFKSKDKQEGYRLAVINLSFQVPAGECFGLLGVNGAGKTTTFKMLIGDIVPDRGDVTVDGLSVVKDKRAAQQSLGYCPQFEGLPLLMTGREVLTMYAKIRGLPSSECEAAA